MNQNNAISNVGNTLVNLLRKNMKSTGVNIDSSDIVLGFPDSSQDYKITLYLYNVLKSSYFEGDSPWSLGHKANRIQPIALELYYLIIINSKAKINRASEEHQLLGGVMQVFQQNAVLENYILGDGYKLYKCQQEFRMLFNPLSLEEVSKIRSAFPKLSENTILSYLVTPVIIECMPGDDESRVLSTNMKFGEIERDENVK